MKITWYKLPEHKHTIKLIKMASETKLNKCPVI